MKPLKKTSHAIKLNIGLSIALILFSLTTCQSPQKKTNERAKAIFDAEIKATQNKELNQPKATQNSTFQKILADAKLTGTILVYDPQKKEYHSNDFARAKKAFLPASTYKIPHTLIALETGVVPSDTTILKWDGQPRRLAIWEKSMPLSDAFKTSCVPCYRAIARKIGVQRMNHYLDKFSFGNMEVDTTNLDLFWLRGTSAITPYEQIDFLERLYNYELPVNKSTANAVMLMMRQEDNEKYTLRAKTGWGIVDEKNIGWFVGYVQLSNNVIHYFATNIEPNADFEMEGFPSIRKKVTKQALAALGLVPE